MNDHDRDNGPEATVRDGALKATIWRNEGETGPYYSTVLSKSYKDRDGEWRETDSLSQNDLLRVSELARSAYHRTMELRRDRTRDADRDQAREDFKRERSQAPDYSRTRSQER